MKTMAASKFKATCLAVMDEVQAKREAVMLTKNGKPVAKLIPVEPEDEVLKPFYFGKIRIVGDIISPVVSLEDYDVLREDYDVPK